MNKKDFLNTFSYISMLSLISQMLRDEKLNKFWDLDSNWKIVKMSKKMRQNEQKSAKMNKKSAKKFMKFFLIYY